MSTITTINNNDSHSDDGDYYQEYNSRIMAYHKNAHLQDINTEMIGEPLSFCQERYWATCIKNLTLKGHLPIPHLAKAWEMVLHDPSLWRPDLKTFIARAQTALRAYRNNERPAERERAPISEEGAACPAMKCMAKTCGDYRNRPYVQWLRWWDKEDKEGFMLHYKKSHPFLKDYFAHFDWQARILEHGYFLCFFHYSKLYYWLYPEKKDEELPDGKWFNPLPFATWCELEKKRK